MKTFAVVACLMSVSAAAPSGLYGINAYGPAAAVGYGPAAVGYGPAAAVATRSAVVPAGPPQAHVSESYHAGPAVAKTYVQHGVVGSRTVQVGSKPVQVGHEFYVADQKVTQAAPYSVVASAPVNTQQTVALPKPALPVAAPYAAAAIPPRPVNLGPAPADTVTQEKVLAPVRTHTRITPQVTKVEPELQVNRYNVDAPYQVPVPVEREVLVEKRVQKPYTVEVPRAVPVPAPYKVHDIHEVVETPIIKQHTVSVHTPAVAVAGYTGAVAGYTGAAVPVGYAGAIATPAIAAVEKKY